ncbi:HpcH/HpaI aldolase/citrate lyase family protein [Apiospora arundinis]
MLQGCKLREALAKGNGPSLGLWQTFPGANISRTLARSAGIDWVMVDCEHGNIDDAAMHDAVPAIAGCGVSPLVRLPDMQGWMIKRALDAGAHGILIPLLRTAEEARQIVRAAKFPPTANESLLTMVQIETKEALDAVEEIAAVPGIDLLFVGPFDLGNNIGLPILDGVMQPGLEEAIDRILEVAHRAGKKAAFFATSGAQSKKYADKGFDMISVALDATALQQTMALSLKSARGLD